MKLNVMFTIAAILLILIAIVSFLAPVLPALGATNAYGTFGMMIGAACMLSLGVIAWLVRNAEASKTRDALVLGYTLLFGLWAVESLVGQFGQFGALPAHNASWVIALIQAFIAVGFFMAGKSSMSKSASYASCIAPTSVVPHADECRALWSKAMCFLPNIGRPNHSPERTRPARDFRSIVVLAGPLTSRPLGSSTSARAI